MICASWATESEPIISRPMQNQAAQLGHFLSGPILFSGPGQAWF